MADILMAWGYWQQLAKANLLEINWAPFLGLFLGVWVSLPLNGKGWRWQQVMGLVTFAECIIF